MAVEPADLIDPKGDVDPTMFPKDDGAQLLLRMKGYLDRAIVLITAAGVTDVTIGDPAARAYAYYLANDAVYRRLSASPLALNMTDQGSRSRSQAQIDSFRDAALRYLAEFTGLVPESPATLTDLSPPGSMAVRNQYIW
jgi:hypothetical protein